MLAKPSSQAGCLASRKTSRGSKPRISWRCARRAPSRWQTEAVAVHRLTVRDSKIASFIPAQPVLFSGT